MLKSTESTIIQTIDNQIKIWEIPELLETFNPLSGEPLTDRNAAMKQAVLMASAIHSDLSETALLRYDFWNQLQTDRISVQKFEYTTKVTDTYLWELIIDSSGLHYKDISGDYNSIKGTVTEQLFSDFWFYGPLLPIPDLSVRKQLVANIRNAFIQAGSPASYKHFELFDYPNFTISTPHWVTGDYDSNEFVTVRNYGIEYGRTTWYDGLVYLCYLSFENFLTVPAREGSVISPEIREEIEKLLSKKASRKMIEDQLKPDDNAESKRLFMESGGQPHYIHLDGFGDVYKATYSEEAAWRSELIDNFTRRLSEEDNESILTYIAKCLELNGVKNVSELISNAAEKASPKTKQALAKILVDHFDAERGAMLLISLLGYESETDYWRNYVFYSFFNLRHNHTVQNFIIQKLKGDNEIHFKKSVDVLIAWSYRGDVALSDKKLLTALNWNDAKTGQPEFKEAIQKIIKIIQN
jgi:hypothetical protein